MSVYCRAPSNIGLVSLLPQAEIGTAVSPSPATDALRLLATPEIEPIGEGRLHAEETESPMPGGDAPELGSYGESITLVVGVPVCESGQLDADHPVIRLFRACGYSAETQAGEVSLQELRGGCVGFGATDRVPVTLTWEQESGLVHSWVDCVGALTELDAGTAGGWVTLTFRLVGRVHQRIEAPSALPAIALPASVRRALTARNGSIEIGDTTDPGGLYAWQLQTGVTAQEHGSQLERDGIDIPLSYPTDPAVLSLTTPQSGGYSVDMWDHFFAMTSAGAMALKIRGNTETDILEVQAPRPYASPQSLGADAGHRTDERELLLIGDAPDPRYTIILREVDAS